MKTLVALLALFLAAAVSAQPKPQPVWTMQVSGTTAGLRGIDAVGGTHGMVAWASGTGGTVLRTIDGGAHWTRCATPDANKDGATLDFRGVQAWDADTAIVMASGPGDKSRLYKTTDGCKKWRLVLKNRSKEGFWDAVYFYNDDSGWLLGDPVKGMFVLYSSGDQGKTWTRQVNKGLRADPKSQGAFAASNSSLFGIGSFVAFGSGGTGGARVYSISEIVACFDACPPEDQNIDGRLNTWIRADVPIGRDAVSSGVFSIGAGERSPPPKWTPQIFVVVGGDYTKPDDSAATAAYSTDSGKIWHVSTTPPHGFRSAVEWWEPLEVWITVGTNGSDISRDDGRTWQLLDNGNWNALSLPFVVGPGGRIARLNAAAIPPARPQALVP